MDKGKIDEEELRGSDDSYVFSSVISSKIYHIGKKLRNVSYFREIPTNKKRHNNININKGFQRKLRIFLLWPV